MPPPSTVVEQLQREPVGMAERIAPRAEHDVGLVGLLGEHRDGRAVRRRCGRLRQSCLARLDRAEELLEALDEVVADAAADADHDALGPVPAVDERGERLARGRTDGLLGADDVAAERVVAVEELVVDAADEVARRVEVHVHLLDDHALLALDLLGVEARVADHVDEHVERHVAGAGGALDVVARVLLAGEGVELAADPVDLGRDVARRRAPLGALEEHVLGEVGDAADLGRLVARAGREHDEARDRLRLRHRRREHANAVRQRCSLEDGHRRIVDTACTRAWDDAARQ